MNLSLQFKRPESYIVSVRLNREESRVFTDEARRVGGKLSTTIKALALEASANRRQVQGARAPLAAGGGNATVYMTSGRYIEPCTSNTAPGAYWGHVHDG